MSKNGMSIGMRRGTEMAHKRDLHRAHSSIARHCMFSPSPSVLIYTKVQIQFRLICRDSDSKRFLAFAEPLDLDKFHKSYSEQQEEAAKTIDLIADFCSTDFPDFCYRDSSGEYHHCNSDCPTNSPKLSGTSTCPFQEWDRCNDQIRWIKTASFLSCYFRDPPGASSQNILNGLSNHHFIHHYRQVLDT